MVITTADRKPAAPHFLVATIAGCRGHDVVRGLSRGLDPVMTGRATAWRHPDVPKRRTDPRHRAMATIAGHRGGNMRRGFALYRAVVVTSGAGPGRHPVMRKEGGFPVCRAVTAAAVRRRRQVVRRLKG